MGTIINGNKWSGACVNGNIVSGLVKNGVVFYKKMQSIYKRRIMEGDNLSYKTIYCDFPENYYQIISEEIGTGNQRRVIISDVQTTYIVENNLSPNFEVRVINGVQWQNNIYNYQNGNLITNLTSLSLENFGNVITVNDNQAYRHIYIEDPNIRPIKVGDMITKNTVFYFNFPDDIYLELPETRTQIITITDHPATGIAADKNTIYSNLKGASVSGWEYYLYKDGEVITNKSKVEGLKEMYGGMIVGEVTKILKDNPVYQYILVDTTTLGN